MKHAQAADTFAYLAPTAKILPVTDTSYYVVLVGEVFGSVLLVVPTFDTKVTEYLCSGWVFFLQTNFDFLTSHF